MERVTFLVERTGERIPCLLNPEHLEVRRAAGIVRRRSATGAIIGNPRTDDPLIATGGGTTDYEFKLLFDVDLLASLATAVPTVLPIAPTLAPATEADGALAVALMDQAESAPDVREPESGGEESPVVPSDESPAVPSAAAPAQTSLDVRTLTQPLWALAENGDPLNGIIAPQRVRFIWGRSWNVPGVILAVAERHDRFDEQGVPKRSWLTLLLRRVEEEVEAGNSPQAPTSPQFEINAGDAATDDSGDDSIVVPVDDEGTALTPLYLIAADRYGDPRYDRAIADYNDLDDLLELEEGRALRLPPTSSVAAEG